MPSSNSDDPKQNHILAALTPKEYARLVDDLELVSLKQGQVLYDAGDTPNYVYFPTTCIISRIFTTQNGASVELAMTGNEGLVGISLILGGDTVIYRVDVQSPGKAYRAKAEVIHWEFDQGGDLQRLSLLHTQTLMTQIAQSVVCNRHHTVDQQLCRWLLLYLDRVSGNQIEITQERISNMLGVRREGVTEAAGKLQTAGLIHYSRGHIEVIDWPGLEARACECYATVRLEQDRLHRQAPETRVKDRARPNPATLRRRAEARLRDVLSVAPVGHVDGTRLLHELQVHQIELEMQQEELLAAYDEADTLRERYADIYDFAPTGYFTLDAQGTILDLNLAGAILLGIKRSQKNRYRFASSVATEHMAAFNQFIDDVLKKKGKKRCEIALLANAHRAEVIVRIEAVSDENDCECRMIVIDISDEKRAEKALEEQAQYQRALLDNFPFMVWLKDDKSRFLAVNKPFAEHFGYSTPEVLVGKTDFDVLPQALAEAHLANDQALLQGNQKWDVEELVELNGENHCFETYQTSIEIDGQRVGTVGFTRDITQRHALQQALVDAEKQQSSFMGNLPLSVTVTQDGLIKYINPKGLELCGYTAEECVGHSFLPLVFEADRPQAMADHEQRMHGEPRPWDFERRLVSKTGRVMDCHCNVSLMKWEGHMASLAIIEDVTETKHLRAELKSLEKIDLLTRMANRQHFTERMDEALSLMRRDTSLQVAVLVIELTHIAEINKTLGDTVGDATLRLFSSLLNDNLRTADVGGRIGDTSFAILLQNTDPATALVFAERLQEKVTKVSVSLAMKVGVTSMNASDTSAAQVMARASKALLSTKSGAGKRMKVVKKAEPRKVNRPGSQ